MNLKTDCPWHPARGRVQVGVDVIAPYGEELSGPQPAEETWELGIDGEPHELHPLVVRELRTALPRLRNGSNLFELPAAVVNAAAERAARQG